MFGMMKLALAASSALVFSFSMILNATVEDQRKDQMIRDLEFIKNNFEISYAPAQWKTEHFGWNLEQAFNDAKNQILSIPSITTKQFQQILRSFFRTTHDFHVEAHFCSSELASLPFTIRGVEDRYFINWVDNVQLPVYYHGIRAGDELIAFDGKPVVDAIATLISENSYWLNNKTVRRIAEIKLTNRDGRSGDNVPNGSVMVTTRSIKTGKLITQQLRWSYKADYIDNSLENGQEESFRKNKNRVMKPRMSVSPFVLDKNVSELGGLVDARKSFLPTLGDVLWTNEDDLEEGQEFPFWYAYIYTLPTGNTVGYIRIPHYDFEEEMLKDFGKIINMFEDKTDALVIDQLHNGGGYVHLQYALLSMLTNQPLESPYHRIKITNRDTHRSFQRLEMLKKKEYYLLNSTPVFELKNIFTLDEDDEDSDSYNFQGLLYEKAYHEFIIKEWNLGRTFTNLTPISSMDWINPHPKYQYTRPIIMLIDEMDFSGADFVPAILQDNKRALLFGECTAGAGGYIGTLLFPNNHGIEKCQYTASLAERKNSDKIENLGVTPDVQYSITIDDVLHGYNQYISRVNKEVLSLLGLWNSEKTPENGKIEDVLPNPSEEKEEEKEEEDSSNLEETPENEEINDALPIPSEEEEEEVDPTNVEETPAETPENEEIKDVLEIPSEEEKAVETSE